MRFSSCKYKKNKGVGRMIHLIIKSLQKVHSKKGQQPKKNIMNIRTGG